MINKNFNSKREIIRRFLNENPKATYRKIRKELGIKIEREYRGGMREAFNDAGLRLPRNFKIKSKEEKKKIIIDYIRKNPETAGQKIRKDTKINFLAIFKNTCEAFEAAGVKYPRKTDKRKAEQKKKQIIELIKKNPLITIIELAKKTKTKPYNFFKDIKSIYREANIEYVSPSKRIITKKKQMVINFIKRNPFATQREINKTCKTHVQDLFKEGIFEAYRTAGVNFPYEKVILYGTALKQIKQRAKSFEDKIAVKLAGYGKVNRLIKTKRGFADIIFEIDNKKAIIEIKDYQSKEISFSQIKQLNKYMEDCNCNLGFLVCNKKPKKDKLLIGKNKILALEESELNKIPRLVKGDIGQW